MPVIKAATISERMHHLKRYINTNTKLIKILLLHRQPHSYKIDGTGSKSPVTKAPMTKSPNDKIPHDKIPREKFTCDEIPQDKYPPDKIPQIL